MNSDFSTAPFIEVYRIKPFDVWLAKLFPNTAESIISSRTIFNRNEAYGHHQLFESQVLQRTSP